MIFLRCVLLLCVSLSLAAQESHRRPLPPLPVPPVPVAKPTLDVAKLKRQANELATLAQSIPPDIEQVEKGLLPKDLNDKLKRIEKLSKQIRKELLP